MNNRLRLTLLLELVWWIATAVVIIAVLYPIHKSMRFWPFEQWNIAFIIIVITIARYIFLLKHTLLAKRQVLKFIIVVLMVPMTFFMISGLNGFMVWVEENTWESLTGHLPTEQRRNMENYLYNQMIFFGAGSVICGPALALRLLMSIWRTHNRGTV
jgi:FlaA1/EpsC-like NDP-sugar epimerase